MPPWNAQGFLPAVNFDHAESNWERSPYKVSLSSIVNRFASTTWRCTLLDGLLRYRAGLQALGYVEGFQWIGGSFLEDAEWHNKVPGDIDVVTFYYEPQHRPYGPADAKLFRDRRGIRAGYNLDALAVSLDGQPLEDLADAAAYWSSIWGHRRVTFAWKGFLQVTMNPVDDSIAAPVLHAKAARLAAEAMGEEQ